MHCCETCTWEVRVNLRVHFLRPDGPLQGPGIDGVHPMCNRKSGAARKIPVRPFEIHRVRWRDARWRVALDPLDALERASY